MKISTHELSKIKGIGPKLITRVQEVIREKEKSSLNGHQTDLSYPKDYINNVVTGRAEALLTGIPDNTIDLIITSPPYDELREYEGYTFNFKAMAHELHRVLAQGGVMVWNVSDQTIHGSETLTSFRQALYFKDVVGFTHYDTMFYERAGRIPTESRYYNTIEYVFVLSKGKPKTLNFIEDHRNKTEGNRRQKDMIINKGKNEKKLGEWYTTGKYSRRSNVWTYGTYRPTEVDQLMIELEIEDPPAIFPEKMAADHITSWTDQGDIVLDPMCGAGTSLKAAKTLNRKYIGMDISENYTKLSRLRLDLFEWGELLDEWGHLEFINKER